jgi:hypothetical protein
VRERIIFAVPNIVGSDQGAGLPDFSWRNIPKQEKIYQKELKIFQMITEYANAHKMNQMAIIYTNIFIPRPSKIYQNRV